MSTYESSQNWWVRIGIHCTLRKRVRWEHESNPDMQPMYPPQFGVVYTISGITNNRINDLCIYLEELDALRSVGASRDAFNASAFRPLTREEEDLHLFEHLKNPSQEDILKVRAIELDDLWKKQTKEKEPT